MSAGAYINRIKVQSQARNVKVQYPGGKATNYNPLYATCSSNPNFSILNYVGIPIGCSTTLGSSCQPSSSCLPTAGEILDGLLSNSNATCIFDGGFSSSNYTPILSGGNSSP